ncbi:hypothetical protein GSI_14690 [Ganoderma sinense ZZ0214-1]|uniref:Uncharacterized protein n=1 Tax=Ganoderma sinense ZZ0214-1 TaxID=1077348 RepID=A0A2G8RPF0_9APHY|nr:hypothetical protein GSI_14690 [Ganoderma sinense ZZ0214-1]
MVVGMATVAAGLGAFWMLQFRGQNRNPAEMSTWHHRHTQQVAAANDQVDTPCSGTKITPREPLQPQAIRDMPAADGPGTAAAGRQGSSQPPSLSPAREDRSILASILTFIRGDPKDRSRDGYVGQPAQVRKLNDRGGVYTKNSEYKDSYRRE